MFTRDKSERKTFEHITRRKEESNEAGKSFSRACRLDGRKSQPSLEIPRLEVEEAIETIFPADGAMKVKERVERPIGESHAKDKPTRKFSQPETPETG